METIIINYKELTETLAQLEKDYPSRMYGHIDLLSANIKDNLMQFLSGDTLTVELDDSIRMAYIGGMPIVGHVYGIYDYSKNPTASEIMCEQINKAKKEAERLGIYERVFGKVAMEDKSLHTSSQPPTISEGLQNFIDAMVEEIVLEGRAFDTQKKYLRKFSENEGLDYESIENGITELIETFGEMKSTDSKSLLKLALIQAKEAYVTEAEVLKIVEQINKEDDTQSAKQNALAGIVQSLQNQAVQDETRESNNDFKAKEPAKYEYVDLGLPSGTLWATFNVGATKPEEFGDYFAWGETAPKTTYNWETYKHCNGARDQLTKYCGKSWSGYNGYTDKLFILQPSDDAATVNWGKDWRTPLIEEWGELRENTSYMWTTLNGVKGCQFTARNGNTLFLPAAGNREGMQRHDDLGRYWSSTLDYYYRNPRSSAHYIGFSPNGCGIGFISYRSEGFSVRPVRSGTGIAARQTQKGGLGGILSSFLRNS